MTTTAPAELAEALAGISGPERRALLHEAEQLSRARCCGGSALFEHLDVAAAERGARIAKALADPIRVQLFDLLRRHHGEVCQCELQPLFDVSQPTLSHHLRKLVDSGLVTVERRGKWAYYSINDAAQEELKSWLS
jgi:ArsR family transcriptional regulator